MPLLADDDANYLREQFAALSADVTLTVVARERSRLVLPGAVDDDAADSSAEVKQIVGEVAATSPRFKVVEVDALTDADRAAALSDGRTPAIIFGGSGAKGRLRYFGLPAGYEMSTLVAALMDLGSGESMLPVEIADELGRLEHEVHIQVFVTPG